MRIPFFGKSKSASTLVAAKAVDFAEEFIASAQAVLNKDTLPVRRAQVLAEIEAIEREKREPFSVEKKGMEKIEEKIADLKEEIYRLELQKTFPRLNPKPFSWLDGEGFPRLLAFSLDSPIFGLGVLRGNYSHPVWSYYGSLGNVFHSGFNWGIKDKQFSYEFVGVIPAKIRERIRGVINRFDDIFIITRINNSSAVVVGFKHNSLWIVADFGLVSVQRFNTQET